MLNVGLFAKIKLAWTVFGLVALQDPPPPVQTPAPAVTTVVCDVVDSVCVPEHETPSVAEPHV